MEFSGILLRGTDLEADEIDRLIVSLALEKLIRKNYNHLDYNLLISIQGG
jgi:hypothetical protein